MTSITDSELTLLYEQKGIIQRKIYRYEITEEEGNKLLEELDIKIKQRTFDILSNYKNNNIIENKTDVVQEQPIENIQNTEGENMPEEQKKKETVVKEVKEKKTHKTPETSNAFLICEALQRKSIKNVEAVADYVVEKKPGKDRKKLLVQIKNIIKQTKEGKRPTYTWDDGNFLLVLKQ